MLTVNMRDGTWVKLKADRFETDSMGFLYTYEDLRPVAFFAPATWNFVQADAS